MLLYCAFAGIQKHVVITALAAGGGKVVDNWRNEYMADRDSTLRHYIELHTEDFPTPGKLSLLLTITIHLLILITIILQNVRHLGRLCNAGYQFVKHNTRS